MIDVGVHFVTIVCHSRACRVAYLHVDTAQACTNALGCVPSNDPTAAMPFLELSLSCSKATMPRFQNALDDVGALAVTMLDADADTNNEHPILEPGVGEIPLWNRLTMTALFDGGSDALALLAALAASDPGLDWSQVGFRNVDDSDWVRAWIDLFEPMQFGAHTFIVPWNHAIPEAANTPDAAVVRLDPGLAFGSGTHQTTALCLRWLDSLACSGELQGRTVLDFGCGSGILAIAALKLGASSAVAVDYDPQALLATTDNAQRNDVKAQLAAYSPQDEPVQTYYVVVANILASALDTLADTLAARVAPGGRIALSGILHGQEDELLERYAPWFEQLRCERDEEWMRIDGVRSASSDTSSAGLAR